MTNNKPIINAPFGSIKRIVKSIDSAKETSTINESKPLQKF